MGPVPAVFARMVGRNVKPVGDVPVHVDPLEVFGRVIEAHLFEGLAAVGAVLDVVVSDSQIEYVTACKGLALIAVVDVFRPAEDIADGIAGKNLGLDSCVK